MQQAPAGLALRSKRLCSCKCCLCLLKGCFCPQCKGSSRTLDGMQSAIVGARCAWSSRTCRPMIGARSDVGDNIMACCLCAFGRAASGFKAGARSTPLPAVCLQKMALMSGTLWRKSSMITARARREQAPSHPPSEPSSWWVPAMQAHTWGRGGRGVMRVHVLMYMRVYVICALHMARVPQ